MLAQQQGKLELTVHRMSPVDAAGTLAHVPEVVKVQLEKQPGEGYAALGAESADVYIGGVAPGSAAHKAGLREGDRLVSLNGKQMLSFTLLSVELSKLKDQPFELTWRGKEGERTATLTHEPLKQVDEMGQESSPLELGLRPWIAERGPAERVTVELRRGRGA